MGLSARHDHERHCLFIACYLGLAYIANEYQVIFTMIRWCGAAYLFYLAWRVWHAPIVVNELDQVSAPATANKAAGFLLGYAKAC